jgi:hypothetical protein
MLSQLNTLNRQTEGRYASDIELQFMTDYAASYSLRLTTYRKIQAAEAQIVEQVKACIQQIEPGLPVYSNPEISAKCQRDMMFVLRYAAIALLINDTSIYQERVLLWLQTIMRGFKEHQRHSELTYRVMQDVVKQFLQPAEADLFTPILELARLALS